MATHAADAPVVLAVEPDFRIGSLTVSPAQRRIAGAARLVTLEPRWMQVLVALGHRAGSLVSRRELFDRCWGCAVGDDSLNRAIAGLRRAGASFGNDGFTIETVRAAGYVLKCVTATPKETDAVQLAWNSWQRDDPVVDHESLDALEQATAAQPDDAQLWALLALLHRMSAETSPPAQRVRYVERCRAAAARSLALCEGQPIARTALATLPPIFNDWTPRRVALASILRDEPDCAPAAHEMAILEMSTGRPSAAIPLVERLLQRFPDAPTLLYKRMYHLWVLGRLDELDRLSERAIQLWPTHSAIVIARFTALAFTGRLEQAALHVEESERAARTPASASRLSHLVLAALRAKNPASAAYRAAVAEIANMAPMGPVQANGVLTMLAGLCALDEAFAVAEGYYLGRGPVMVAVHHVDSEAEVTNKFRRGTQPLFIPSSAAMRADLRFEVLMRDIGLAAHWRESGIAPDYAGPGRAGAI